MKKLITLGIMLLFLGMTISSTTGLYLEKQSIKPSSSGNILYVGGNGTGNYSKIQDAIDNASDGDTVFVYNDSSPYFENVVVNKSINLIGEDKNTTVIDGGGNGDVVYVSADEVTISGFTIKNSGSGEWPDVRAGIEVDSANNIISDNIITNNFHNVYLNCNSEFNIISDNIIKNSAGSGKGVDFVETNDNHVINNEFENNWYAMRLYSSHDNTISGNTILKGTYSIYFHSSTNNFVTGNTFSESYVTVSLHQTAKNNDIYHNNFFEGTHPDYLCEDDGNSMWDNGEEGNYWYDYNGTDEDGDGIGDTPYNVSGAGHRKDNYPFMKPNGWKNNEPNPPIIDGPTSGKPNTEYDFSFNATDPNDDPVMYIIEWGDTNTEWTEYSDSGEEIILKHAWSEKGDYTIKAKTIDIHGAESNWSTLEVTMPKNQQTNNIWFLRFLERFSLLERLLLPILNRLLFM